MGRCSIIGLRPHSLNFPCIGIVQGGRHSNLHLENGQTRQIFFGPSWFVDGSTLVVCRFGPFRQMLARKGVPGPGWGLEPGQGAIVFIGTPGFNRFLMLPPENTNRW